LRFPQGNLAWLILIYERLVAAPCGDALTTWQKAAFPVLLIRLPVVSQWQRVLHNKNRRQQPAHPPVFFADNLTGRYAPPLNGVLAYVA